MTYYIHAVITIIEEVPDRPLTKNGPADNETRAESCARSIRNAMQSAKRMSYWELKRRTNYARVGTELWEECFNGLVAAGLFRTEEVTGNNYKKRTDVILSAPGVDASHTGGRGVKKNNENP